MRDRLMTLQEVAQYLGVPVATIYGWRHKGNGPPGIRVGRHVRYRHEDLENWLSQHADGSPLTPGQDQ